MEQQAKNSQNPAHSSLPISLTCEIPYPNDYVRALNSEFSRWAFNEERVGSLKGSWRQEVFGVSSGFPLDLEIGTGNGYHFVHHGLSHPERYLVGLELKYKPLIQSIRRALKEGCRNTCMARYHARFLNHIFESEEIDNVYIHFPDPWIKKKQRKHRLICPLFLSDLWVIQRPQSCIEFKTDNRDYFDESLQYFKESPYEIHAVTHDLYNSRWRATNFPTHFEKIFASQNLPIHYALITKG